MYARITQTYDTQEVPGKSNTVLKPEKKINRRTWRSWKYYKLIYALLNLFIHTFSRSRLVH